MSDSGLTPKERFDIYNAHRAAILSMWNFFSVGTLGLVGFVLGAKPPPASKPVLWAAVAGYLAFVVANACVVCGSQKRLRRMADEWNMAHQPGAFELHAMHERLFIVFYAAIAAAVTTMLLAA